MEMKTACLIVHRNFEISDKYYSKLKIFFEDLILNKNVQIFLFGSRSNFDYVCHNIVTELKEKYPFIQRMCYTCKSENCTLESERKYWEERYSYFRKKKVRLLGVEKEVEHKTKWTAGRASYVEINQAMINDSDICIFIMMRITSHKNVNILNIVSLHTNQNLERHLHIIMHNKKERDYKSQNYNYFYNFFIIL